MDIPNKSRSWWKGLLLSKQSIWPTKGCPNSWRITVFQYTITYGIFVKRRAPTFQIVPQIREHLKKENGS
jgi:hypothetical protein